MWNKKEEPPAPRPASAPPVQQAAPVPEIRKEPVPVSSTPYRVPDSDPRGTATIGKAVKIVGQIFTKEDLYVDGDVEGTIESQESKVTVGPNGRVQAGIKAREVAILGQVKGNVEAADKVDLRKDARLEGDIISARISIEDGALFKGSIDIRKAETRPGTGPTITAPPIVLPQQQAAAAAVPVGAGAGIKR